MSWHVVPAGDVIDHETGGDCPCAPTVTTQWREDGSFGPVVLHHAMDGRGETNSGSEPLDAHPQLDHPGAGQRAGCALPEPDHHVTTVVEEIRAIVPTSMTVPAAYTCAAIQIGMTIDEADGDVRVVAPGLQELQVALPDGAVTIVAAYCEMWTRWLQRRESVAG